MTQPVWITPPGTLGNNYITAIRAQVTNITALSDAQDKGDIITLNTGMVS